MQNVAMLSVVMLSVVMLSVVMPNVVAPLAVLHSKGRLLALPAKNYTRMKMTGIDRRTSLLCKGIGYLGKKLYFSGPRFLN
jgi:hypothetical protein